MRYKEQESDLHLQMEPREALTGFLESPGLGRLRLDFLVTYESDALYIRCLDFGIMSCGESIEECKENIWEAILIYLEDLPEEQSIFKPAPDQYWRMFYELRSRTEQRQTKPLAPQIRYALQDLLREPIKSPLVYA